MLCYSPSVLCHSCFNFQSLSVIRPTARRKPEPVPSSDTGEAQKKFGSDVKAISSDAYFGKQENSEVCNHNVHPLPIILNCSYLKHPKVHPISRNLQGNYY